MFEKSLITIEVGYNDIKIVEGTKSIVKTFGIVKTPKDSYVDDCPADVPKLAKMISDFLKDEKIRIKDVAYVIQGQDIAIRHMQTPIMDRKGIMKTLQWETSQYLPQGGEQYLSDYVITEKIITANVKCYKLMVVSVPKKKIEKYLELTQALGLKLSAIDISGNNMCRIFSNVNNIHIGVQSVGVINIGKKNCVFSIIEKDKLLLSREIPFGLSNAAKVMYNCNTISEGDILNFIREFSFTGEGLSISAAKKLFDGIMSNIGKLILFYTTGKTKKFLDRIYIIGEGSEIKEISSYTKEYLNTPVEVPASVEEIGINMKYKQGFNFRNYVNNMGLLLRKE